MPHFGTFAPYLCIVIKKQRVMKNTEYNLNSLSSVISETSFSEIMNMINDMGLEIMDIRNA